MNVLLRTDLGLAYIVVVLISIFFQPNEMLIMSYPGLDNNTQIIDMFCRLPENKQSIFPFLLTLMKYTERHMIEIFRRMLCE